MKMILDANLALDDLTINYLAKSYSTLNYYTQLSALLQEVFPTTNFESETKYNLHKLLNDLLTQNYQGEEIHKYKLAEKHLKKRNIVGAFEMKVNNSRVDFLTINGSTTSFEIKSALDNLTKLGKQITDYLLAFEYNYVVIDEKHANKVENLLPDSFGLWSYKNGAYKQRRKASLNNKIDPQVQLQLLTKRELLLSYPEQEGNTKKILCLYTADEINSSFKKTLKTRYKERWDFLISHQENILPIDIQFFFNNNILPDYIYYH